MDELDQIRSILEYLLDEHIGISYTSEFGHTSEFVWINHSHKINTELFRHDMLKTCCQIADDLRER